MSKKEEKEKQIDSSAKKDDVKKQDKTLKDDKGKPLSQ